MCDGKRKKRNKEKKCSPALQRDIQTLNDISIKSLSFFSQNLRCSCVFCSWGTKKEQKIEFGSRYMRCSLYHMQHRICKQMFLASPTKKGYIERKRQFTLHFSFGIFFQKNLLLLSNCLFWILVIWTWRAKKIFHSFFFFFALLI